MQGVNAPRLRWFGQWSPEPARPLRPTVSPVPDRWRGTRRPTVGRRAGSGDPRRTSATDYWLLTTDYWPLATILSPLATRSSAWGTTPPAADWLRFRSAGSAADGLTSSGNELCVDSGLASFGAFSRVFTPEGRLCRSQAPWYGRSVASIPSCDKIPILSFVKSSMTRLESCPCVRPWLTTGIVSPSCPSPHPPDLTSHPSSAICSLSSAICSLSSAFSASSFPVPNSSFRIFRRVSSVCISSRYRAD